MTFSLFQLEVVKERAQQVVKETIALIRNQNFEVGDFKFTVIWILEIFGGDSDLDSDL